MSRASTFLMRAASEGSPFKRATISVRKHGSQKSGEANGDFLQIRMHNAYIASYQLGSGKGEEGDQPMESIELCYDKIEIVCLEQDQKGAMSQMFQHGWDVGQNKQLAEMTLPYKGGGAKGN